MGTVEQPTATDVVVVGAGVAGLSAAVAARDAGAQVAVAEAWPQIGGLSLLSSGYLRAADDLDGAVAYLRRLSAGTLPDDGVRALAGYLVAAPALLEALAAEVGASAFARFGADLAPFESGDLHDWEGRDALGWTGIDALPGFDRYPHASGQRGHTLVRALELAARARGVLAQTSTRVVDLLVERDADGRPRVGGVVLDGPDGRVAVRARRGVVLATGGFEFDATALADHVPAPGIAAIGHRGNRGDGLRLAARAGAALWHLANVHGSYGFLLPGRDVPIRNHLGGARRDDRPVGWILVDRRGRRFTNEAPRAPQDTPWKALAAIDDASGEAWGSPCWLLFDDDGRRLGPLGRPAWSRPQDRYEWSADNSAEIRSGAIVVAATLDELARRIGVDPPVLRATVAAWNDQVAAGADPLGRPPGTMAPLRRAPFHALRTVPILSNTHGGPRHDAAQRVLDGDGRPIAGLWAAGELGSWFGHRYLLGGNLTEALAGGAAAGRGAAARVRAVAA